jgi:hypothetical protein
MHRVTVKTQSSYRPGGGHRIRPVKGSQAAQQLGLDQQLQLRPTILIADGRGRGEIVRPLNGHPPALRAGWRPTAGARTWPRRLGTGIGALPVIYFLRRNWLEILLPGAVGLIIWAAFNFR